MNPYETNPTQQAIQAMKAKVRDEIAADARRRLAIRDAMGLPRIYKIEIPVA